MLGCQLVAPKLETKYEHLQTTKEPYIQSPALNQTPNFMRDDQTDQEAENDMKAGHAAFQLRGV